MADRKKAYLTPNEVAELLMVSPVTVRQWAQKGLLEARLTAGGHRRFAVETVRSFAQEMGLSDVLQDTQDDTSGPEVKEQRRILVVDDDRQLNGLLVELINGHVDRAVADFAYDGFEAGVKVESFKPDTVLLDIMMPGIDGFDVCRRLKSDPEKMHIKVVAMTGHYSLETSQRIMASGADMLLKKPFLTEDVLAACGLDGASNDQQNVG